MPKLSRDDLWSLEQYAEEREVFRSEVLTHKKDRRLVLGEHIQLIFEDQLTIRYQIQEMLRIEKVFEANGIEEELSAYNPLIPDGDNWKCTMLIQYADVDERKVRLEALIGVESKVWLQLDGCDKIFAIADEDMERSNETKTSAVHFLRFQLTDEMIDAVQRNKSMVVGVDHQEYDCAPQTVLLDVQKSLYKDISNG